jgi:hypothetical protein
MWETYCLGIYINAKDKHSEATEQKTEQMAVGSSPGLANHPKMGTTSCTDILPRVDMLPDSKLGPAGPIAVNDPAAELRGTSSNGSVRYEVSHRTPLVGASMCSLNAIMPINNSERC